MALQGSAYSLKMFVLPESVNIPYVHNFLAGGEFTPTDVMSTAATTMLDELVKVATALRPLRGR
ncbi:hypothetical protein [Actinoplanes sp. TBRC 11911]|uniref:hypothetical protein n=1 Tax=Actinoplanes sp. TBRC 11911 TaxID=2729386 RepID=UPI002007103D|nr:hypothetical protein [Actinoplanes sp. TBRC 11911]